MKTWSRKETFFKDSITALLLTLGATVLRYAFNPVLGVRSPLLFHILAVAAAAQIAGTVSGLIATGLSVVLIDYFFIPPLYTFGPPPNPVDSLALLLFAVVGVFLSVFGGQRKRAQDEIRRTKDNLETAQQIATIGSWESDLVGKLWWSQETYNIFGIPPGTVLNTDDFFERVHPEDRVKVQQAVDQAVQARIPYDIEHRILRKSDGIVRYVHERATIVAGGSIRLIGSVQDITDQKRAEEAIVESRNELQAVIESLVDGVVIIDADGQFTKMNPAALALYGLPPGTCMSFREFVDLFEVTKPNGEIIPPDMYPAARALHGETFRNLELRIRRKDTGKTFIVHYGSALIRNSDGKITHVIISLHDLTETKMLRGLLPTCAHCKKIRDSQGQWQPLEGYISRHSQAKFSHGLCPDCVSTYYSEWDAISGPK